jgi:hypothetical protein
MTVYRGLFIIFFATFASLIIANLPTGVDPGLGGFILWFWPPAVGGVGMMLFLLLCIITKRKGHRLFFIVTWSMYLLYVGVGLFVDTGWYLVYW